MRNRWRGMKRIKTTLRLLFICLAIFFLWITMGAYPTFPLKGRVVAASVTKGWIHPNVKNQSESSVAVIVTNSTELALLSQGLRVVWNQFGPLNSMEGYPRYWVTVQYSNRETSHFYFTRTEWGKSGATPKQLVNAIETIISNNTSLFR